MSTSLHQQQSCANVRRCHEIATILKNSESAVLYDAITTLVGAYLTWCNCARLMSVSCSFQTLELSNITAPSSAKLPNIDFNGQPYELIFSDKFAFETCFYHADDPCCESVDIWYDATNDFKRYDPKQITMSKGKLSIL